MKRSNSFFQFVWICFVFVFIFFLCRIDFAQALTLGKTYNSKNWQEIEDIAPPFLVNWVKKGQFILKTGKINFNFSLEKDFLKASQENSGKFDVNEKGFIVDIDSRKQPAFIYGLPFPKIDFQDAKAGEKIMYNFKYGRMRLGGVNTPFRNMWIGKGGLEREMIGVDLYLYYQGRRGGPIQNPDNFLRKNLFYITEPMDLRGTVSLVWTYNDERLDTKFSYVSATRKIQRGAPSNRSNPAMGTDMALDDNFLWYGKNASFRWKLIGEGKALCAFTTPDFQRIDDLPNGSVIWKLPSSRVGFDIPHWKGSLWAPASATWSLRPVWFVEGIPKDPKYNYGRQLFYVDKETYMLWFKQVYDRVGQHWKGMMIIQSFQVAPSGKNNLFQPDAIIVIDDKVQHATYEKFITFDPGGDNALHLPVDVLGPRDFTVNAAQQLSK